VKVVGLAAFCGAVSCLVSGVITLWSLASGAPRFDLLPWTFGGVAVLGFAVGFDEDSRSWPPTLGINISQVLIGVAVVGGNALLIAGVVAGAAKSLGLLSWKPALPFGSAVMLYLATVLLWVCLSAVSFCMLLLGQRVFQAVRRRSAAVAAH
jgi:hypothetical protein